MIYSDIQEGLINTLRALANPVYFNPKGFIQKKEDRVDKVKQVKEYNLNKDMFLNLLSEISVYHRVSKEWLINHLKDTDLSDRQVYQIIEKTLNDLTLNNEIKTEEVIKAGSRLSNVNNGLERVRRLVNIPFTFIRSI